MFDALYECAVERLHIFNQTKLKDIKIASKVTEGGVTNPTVNSS